MPLFEFQCDHCSHRFEELLPSLSGPVPSCPECGSDQVRRLFSPVAPPGRQPRGPAVRDSESRRVEREAARSQRLADAASRRARGDSPRG